MEEESNTALLTDLVIFDEVQFCPHAHAAIKHFF